MAYVGDLGMGQQIYVENQETQTLIALVSGGSSQQQSQRNGFETGNWTLPPTLFRTSNGLVLRIEATGGQFYVSLQASGMSTLATAPSLMGADILPLQQVADEGRSTMPPMEPMRPMEPMKPMKPMPPMQMQMGNMRMQMGAPEPIQSIKRFCSQCGHAVDTGDRFCSECGNCLS